MKKSILSVISLCILIAFGSVLFHACQDENLQGINSIEQGIEDVAEGLIVEDEEYCDSSGEEEYDDEFVENEFMDVPDGEVGDETGELVKYCVYEVVNIVKTNDPFKSMKKGDKLCYTCPGDTCPEANKVRRKFRHFYYTSTGKVCFFFSTVEISSTGGACTYCPMYGKILKSNTGKLPGQ